MKNVLMVLMGLFFSFQSYSQQIYWQCSNVIIDNPSAFLSVWDDFMESDLGKSCSPNAIFQFNHSSSEYAATHQVCWFSDDGSQLQANFQKFMNYLMVDTI